jgi:hypothetical protein
MPDDKRVTIVAVLVTGIVGVLGPLITWRATVDSQRAARAAAREVQQLAGRQQSAESDLSELRSVLDSALLRLNTLEARAKGKWRVWRRQANPPDLLVEAQQGLTKAFVRARTANLQLRVRLGEGDAIYESYDDAIYNFGKVGDLTRSDLSRARINRVRVANQVSEAAAEADKSIEAAFRLVKSRLK